MIGIYDFVNILFVKFVKFNYLFLQLELLLVKVYQIVPHFFGRSAISYFFNSKRLFGSWCWTWLLLVFDDVLIESLVKSLFGGPLL
jgi:hypothetical protein